MKFQKMAVIGPTQLTETSRELLRQRYAKEVLFYPDLPRSEQELVQWISDSDALLVSLQVQVTRQVIFSCQNLRYIGMCCSLYDEKSANVDILTARERGITVTGIRDYGDEGVVEYVISELVQLLHGFHYPQWREKPQELTGQKIGILGMGTLGHKISRALLLFGAEIYYYSRSRKKDAEEWGVTYLPLDELMQTVEICIGCLNKNAIIVGEEQLKLYGNEKILMNVAIGPFAKTDALRKWLSYSHNYYLCDELWGLGDPDLARLPNVYCLRKSAGSSQQSIGRYNQKILENLEKSID